MSSTDYNNEFDNVKLNLIRKVMKKSESFHNFALDYLATEKFDGFLKEIPFSKGLDNDSIKRISEQAEMKEYYKGEIIQHQNEISDLFYVILKGKNKYKVFSIDKNLCLRSSELLFAF